MNNNARRSTCMIIPTDKGKVLEFVANAANKENEHTHKRTAEEGTGGRGSGGVRGRGRGRGRGGRGRGRGGHAAKRARNEAGEC
jgi:hypothetical protein